jgi:hypothetical protein
MDYPLPVSTPTDASLKLKNSTMGIHGDGFMDYPIPIGWQISSLPNVLVEFSPKSRTDCNFLYLLLKLLN